MSDTDVIQSMLNFSLGIERILKGILFNVNPIYTLSSPDFSHSMPVLYQNKIRSKDEHGEILHKKPVADVITYRTSLLRAATISWVTQNRKGLLFSISRIRDTIAHHDLSSIDLENAREILLRDFYLVILDFSEELKIPRDFFFGTTEEKLSLTALSHQTNLKDHLRLKINNHARSWTNIINNNTDTTPSKLITSEILESGHRFSTSCPACLQEAVLYTKPEYTIDPQTVTKNIQGEFVDRLKCEFCNLLIHDQRELDELGLSQVIDESMFEFDDDIPF